MSQRPYGIQKSWQIGWRSVRASTADDSRESFRRVIEDEGTRATGNHGRMALVSVNEYLPELGGITSRYTRSSPLAGTFAVAANEQHVSEVRSNVSCDPQ